MVEWFKALVLKTSEVQASVGSNPTLSAIFLRRRQALAKIKKIIKQTLAKQLKIVYTV